MLSTLISTPCTIVRRGSSDEETFGERTRTESDVATVCEIQQTQRTEPPSEGELSVTTWDAFFPAGTQLDTNDEVLTDELGEFEVIGKPWRTRNPRTQQFGQVEVTLKQTRGPEGS